MKEIISIIIIAVLFTSCGSDPLPKPKPYLKLTYPQVNYNKFNSECPYSFEVSKNAIVDLNSNCWVKIKYPKLKATIHITYREVDNNLKEILKEVEKLTFEHTIKADIINSTPYENMERKVYGKLYNIEGNVATNIQFRVTDSVKNVLSGALYFYAKPNYDSIVPAVKYLEKDIMRLVETLEWK